MNKVLTFLIASLFIIIFIPKAEAIKDETFNHQYCQYPDRWFNPADSCNNSDPANPECIKEMYSQQAETDCIANKLNKATTPAINYTEYENAKVEGYK